MRSISGTLATKQVAKARRPTLAITKSKSFTSFSSKVVNDLTILDASIPITSGMSADGTYMYVSGHKTNGDLATAKITVANLAATPTWTYGTVGQRTSMRTSWHAGHAVTCLWDPAAGDKAFYFYWDSNSPHTGEALTANIQVNSANDSTKVIRCEASLLIGNYVVAAIGTHNFTLLNTVIDFYVLDMNGNTFKMKNRVEFPMPDGTTYTNWYSVQKEACYISAIQLASNKILVVANDSTTGSPIGFTWQNGVESEQFRIAGMMPEILETQFWPTGLTYNNSLYYLSGTFIRKASTADGLSFDCFLTSANGIDWSFGERSFFIEKGTLRGSFSNPVGTTRNYWFYNGGSRYFDQPSSTDVSTDIIQVALSQRSDSADSLSILSREKVIEPGDKVVLNLGFEGEHAQIGEYIVDEISFGVNDKGKSDVTASSKDEASYKLGAPHRSPVDMQLDSSYSYDSSLLAFEKLIQRAGWGSATASAYGSGHGALVHFDLNNPAIFQSVNQADANALVKLTTRFNLTDLNCAQSIGVMFGGDDKGQFNALMIPRNTNWMTIGLVPTVSKSLLTANSTWSINKGYAGLFSDKEIVHDDYKYARILSPITTVNMGPQNSYSIAPATKKDLAVRIFGKRIQLYEKNSPEDITDFSGKTAYVLILEHELGPLEKGRYDPTPRVGILMNTDVAVFDNCFDSSGLSDTTMQLTDAGEYWKTIGEFTRVGGTGEIWGGANNHILEIADANVRNNFTVGMVVYVKKTGSEGTSNWATITRIRGDQPGEYNSTPFGLEFGYEAGTGIFGVPSSAHYQFTANFGRHASPPYTDPVWAYADSSYMSYKLKEFATDQNGIIVDVPNAPAGKKFPVRSGAKVFFVSDDGTAGAARYVESDGSRHDLYSGSPITYLGWDRTSPVGNPSPWRMIMNHGRFFDGDAGDFGLPDGVASPAYFRKGDEVMRYLVVNMSKWGVYPEDTPDNTTWTVVPTYYAPLKAMVDKDQFQFKQWQLTTGSPPAANRPGDDFGQIPNAPGLLFEIQSKDISSYQSDEVRQYYVDSVTYVAPVAGQDSNTSYVTLTADRPYPNPSRGPQDIGIVSGRGQFETKKTIHDSSEPVLYYPATSLIENAIEVTRLAWNQNPYLSVEDDIRKVCAHYGVRDVTFRNLYYNATLALGTSPVTLVTSRADFMLEYIGPIHNQYPLKINFRGKYNLYISNDTSAKGQVKLKLEGDPVSGPGTIELESVLVKVSDHNYQNTDITAAAGTVSLSILHTVRVIVSKLKIQVEMDGQVLWVFWLDHFPSVAKFTDKGDIKVSFSGHSETTTVSIRVPELWEEMESHVVDIGQDGISAVGFIISERLVKLRTTSTGGLEFGRFNTRDVTALSIGSATFSDDQGNNEFNVAGHLYVTGAEIGEYLDEPWVSANGYIFGNSQNRLLNTITDAENMAKIILRDAIESANARKIAYPAMLQIQPEDIISFSYSAPNDVPDSPTPEDYVVNSLSIEWALISADGVYEVRKARELQ